MAEDRLSGERLLELARYVARDYDLPGAEKDDVVQIAALEGLEALARFDPSRGVSAVGFVAWCMRRRIGSRLRTALRPTHAILTDARRVVVDSDGELVDVVETLAAPAADVVELVELRLELERIRAAAGRLTAFERAGLAWRLDRPESVPWSKALDNGAQGALRKLRPVV